MRFERAYIPVDFIWSSPFVRWQGAFAQISSLVLAEQVTKRALAARGFDPASIDEIVLGWTVPQPEGFYGAPTLAARIGAPGVTGPMLSQACATSAASLQAAAAGVECSGGNHLELVVTTDRTSNGPTLLFPQPTAPGGSPLVEEFVLDNFKRDPLTQQAMLMTAEAVAEEGGFSRQELDDLTLMRYEQYSQAQLEPDRGRVISVDVANGRKDTRSVDSDEGVHPTNAAGLAGLKPSTPGGVVTFGSQTHPADGCAGAVVTTKDQALELSEAVAQVISIDTARAEPARMPKAPVEATHRALRAAGLEMSDIDAVTTHNPFAVNDLWFCSQTGFPPDQMNQLGCSLIYGHPQGPTGLRLIGELVEVLRRRGGGTGLFTGCAAGDTAMAVVVKVT